MKYIILIEIKLLSFIIEITSNLFITYCLLKSINDQLLYNGLILAHITISLDMLIDYMNQIKFYMQ